MGGWEECNCKVNGKDVLGQTFAVGDVRRKPMLVKIVRCKNYRGRKPSAKNGRTKRSPPNEANASSQRKKGRRATHAIIGGG